MKLLIIILLFLLTIPFKTITQSSPNLASQIQISVHMTKTITCGGQIFFTDSVRTRLH